MLPTRLCMAVGGEASICRGEEAASVSISMQPRNRRSNDVASSGISGDSPALLKLVQNIAHIMMSIVRGMARRASCCV